MTDIDPRVGAHRHAIMPNEYDYEEGKSFDDQLVAFRNRANNLAVDGKNSAPALSSDFHRYSISANGDKYDSESHAPIAYPAGVPLEVPFCIRRRKDVEHLFAPRSIHSIIHDSRTRAATIVRSHFLDDESGFHSDAADVGAEGDTSRRRDPRAIAPHDTSLNSALAAVNRPDHDVLQVMITVRDRLAKALSERGRVPAVLDARKRVVDKMARERVHSACHSNRLMTKELMLHSTDIPERFAFGTLRDPRRAGSRRFLRGASDEQRVGIQNRWNGAADHHVVGAVRRYSDSDKPPAE